MIGLALLKPIYEFQQTKHTRMRCNRRNRLAGWHYSLGPIISPITLHITEKWDSSLWKKVIRLLSTKTTNFGLCKCGFLIIMCGEGSYFTEEECFFITIRCLPLLPRSSPLFASIDFVFHAI